MKILAIMNLKGGVGKTTTSTSMAYLLSRQYRVLLVDNDKQGNASKLFKCYDRNSNEMVGRLLTHPNPDVYSLIKKTDYANLDVLPSNMNLINDCMKLTLDTTRPQQLCYKKALQIIEDDYDFCIIDNPPDINIAVINALVAANDVIIPTVNDAYSHEGMDILVEQLKIVKDNFNPSLTFGCLITQYQNDDVNRRGLIQLLEMGYPVIDIKIRRTERRVSESTYKQVPLPLFSPRSGAALAYKRLVDWYLKEHFY